MTPEPSVRVREVGPRDGFQNERENIATGDKIRLIDALSRTGVGRLEVTSFVRADVIPQLADAAEVIDGISVPDGIETTVLVPNRRGLDVALGHSSRFDRIGVFLSASESHNRRNVNRSTAESLAACTEIIAAASAAGLPAGAVIATAFGCPYEGVVRSDHVIRLAAALAEAGADEIGFGDTTGMANPRQVARFFRDAAATLPSIELTAHFHNTRGQGLANVLGALDAGCISFESSFGELGGCPVPAGATGNIATEDLVSMLHEMGYDTGIDLPKLLSVVQSLREVLGRPLGSHLPAAGPVDWTPRLA
jgi:hydroxymethylglutaryl-CoA lyase